MITIPITIRRKKATNPVNRIVCGNKNYTISFDFDAEWLEYPAKTARFIYDGQISDVVFEGHICPVPMLTAVDMVAVGVFAGDLITSTPAIIGVDRSILCSGGAPSEPTPDVYAQIMELLNSGIGEEVTAASIKSALGYTPADQKAVDALSAEKVSVNPQELTDEQKAQARANIAAAGLDPDCHAAYFQITDDGVVSLKPEYRGATTKATYAASVSDKGSGVVGSKNAELPAHLVIPEIVEGIVVNNLAAGMFCGNKAVEYVTLPKTIKEIPDYCFRESGFLKELYNTENITSLGECALCRASSLIRANFPNLTSMGIQSIQGCPSLVYVNVGKVEKIAEFSLAYNINLQRVKNDGSVKTIDATVFEKCGKLKYFENLAGVTSVGATGLWGSGIPYTELQTMTNCTFGTFATALQVNPTDYWSGCTYTPCENPLPTYLAQNNPLWASRPVGSKTYGTACSLFDVVHAYCALHNITLRDVDELEALVNGINPSLLANFTSAYTYQTTLATGLGMKVEYYGTVDQTVLQTLYNALAAGKYASATIANGNNGSIKGHVALIYGVNERGELLICDCQSAWWHDLTKPFLYSMPYQNFFAPSIENRNRILEIYSL